MIDVGGWLKSLRDSCNIIILFGRGWVTFRDDVVLPIPIPPLCVNLLLGSP
jgi:hypothetical protein